MKNILVTTDFSAESKSAYSVAMSLAEPLKAKLHLLFVSQSIPALASGYAMDTPTCYIDPEVQKQITTAQKADLENERKLFTNFEIETHFSEAADMPNTEIVKMATNIKADYIIMASHGRTGFARIIMGSITERVLRDAPCPVVVVPTKPALQNN